MNLNSFHFEKHPNGLLSTEFTMPGSQELEHVVWEIANQCKPHINEDVAIVIVIVSSSPSYYLVNLLKSCLTATTNKTLLPKEIL